MRREGTIGCVRHERDRGQSVSRFITDISLNVLLNSQGELRDAEDKKASPVHYEGGSMNDAEQERDPGCQKIKEDRA